MRLNSTHKMSIMRAIIRDMTALEEYPEVIEAKEKVEELVLKALPVEIKSAYSNTETRQYLNCGYFIELPRELHLSSTSPLPYYIRSPYLHSLGHLFGAHPIRVVVQKDGELFPILKKLHDKLKEREELLGKIWGLVNSASTVNSLKKVLPSELHFYLPTVDPATRTNSDRSLPVPTNLMADLRNCGLKLRS